MATKNKQEIQLDGSDTTVTVGANKPLEEAGQVLVTDWNPGQAPHKSISLGLILQLVEKGYIQAVGEYQGTPVVERKDIYEAIDEALKAKFPEVDFSAIQRTGGGAKVLKETNEAAIKCVMDMNSCTREEALAQINKFKGEE